jgi:hypothetical protein
MIHPDRVNHHHPIEAFGSTANSFGFEHRLASCQPGTIRVEYLELRRPFAEDRAGDKVAAGEAKCVAVPRVAPGNPHVFTP